MEGVPCCQEAESEASSGEPALPEGEEGAAEEASAALAALQSAAEGELNLLLFNLHLSSMLLFKAICPSGHLNTCCWSTDPVLCRPPYRARPPHSSLLSCSSLGSGC
jgi:hypothetical protein